GIGDGPGAQRVGDDDLAGALGQKVGDWPGVGGGLEHDLIIWAERAGKVPQRLRLGRDAQLTFLLPLEDRDLREVTVDVQTDGAHALFFFLDTTAGDTTTTDSRSRRNR